MQRWLDSTVSPLGVSIPATGSGLLTLSSSSLYTVGPDQVLNILQVAGEAHPFAAGDDGFLSVVSIQIVAELYGDTAATEFIADLVLANGAGSGPLTGESGFAVRSAQRGREAITVIDSTYALVGNNVNQAAKTVQAVLFILEAEIANSDAAAHDAGATLVCLVQIDQQVMVAK